MIFFRFLALCFLVLIIGCGKNLEPKSEPKSEPKPAEQSAPFQENKKVKLYQGVQKGVNFQIVSTSPNYLQGETKEIGYTIDSFNQNENDFVRLYEGVSEKINAGEVTIDQNHKHGETKFIGFVSKNSFESAVKLYVGTRGNVNLGMITTSESFLGGSAKFLGYALKSELSSGPSSDKINKDKNLNNNVKSVGKQKSNQIVVGYIIATDVFNDEVVLWLSSSPPQIRFSSVGGARNGIQSAALDIPVRCSFKTKTEVILTLPQGAKVKVAGGNVGDQDQIILNNCELLQR